MRIASKVRHWKICSAAKLPVEQLQKKRIQRCQSRTVATCQEPHVKSEEGPPCWRHLLKRRTEYRNHLQADPYVKQLVEKAKGFFTGVCCGRNETNVTGAEDWHLWFAFDSQPSIRHGTPFMGATPLHLRTAPSSLKQSSSRAHPVDPSWPTDGRPSGRAVRRSPQKLHMHSKSTIVYQNESIRLRCPK